MSSPTPAWAKTYELIAEAQQQRNRGRKAFFIRIEDVDEAFGAAFEVGTPEEFESWLSGTDEAWFFLDSVDEVRLEAPRAFETAIAAFASRIHNAYQRAHVCISSRPYAWRPKTDRALVEELLPYKPPVAEATGADAKRQAPSKKDENPGGLALYRLAPLDDDDIRVFAGHRNISDADPLLDALKRKNLLALAERPFDLEDILAVWIDTHSLDSRLAVLEHGLRRRLRPPTGKLVTLSLEKAEDGARRLAIAATLTGEASIRMPGVAGSGLDAIATLPDWTEAEVTELLGRGVFTDAIYSAVRFRHRESRELLAARWLSGKLADPSRRAEIEGLLFREVYGERVIVPRTRPLLPWLVLFDEGILDRAIALKPDVIIEGGDPALLPFKVRQRILRDIVEQIATGQSRGGDNSEIARIAQEDLSEDTLTLIDAHGTNDDVAFFLGRLVWQGSMAAAAQRLSRIARDPNRDVYARIVSVRAVMSVGSPDAAKAMWQALNATGEMLQRRLLTEIVECAPPEIGSVDLLLRSLDAVEPYKEFETTGLSAALHELINRLPLTSERAPERPLVRLAEGLAEFLAREPFIERRECRVSEKFKWLMAPAMHVVERLIISRSTACFEPAVMSVLSRAPALRHWSSIDRHEHEAKLKKLVPRWPELNDALFWHTVAMVRESKKDTDNPVVDDWSVSWMGHFWEFNAKSFPRMIEWIAARTLPEDRSLALGFAFRTYVTNERPSTWRRLLWRTVRGDERLESELRTLMRPPKLPRRSRTLADHRQWEQRRLRTAAKEAENRTALAARLKADPGQIREPPGLAPGQMSRGQAYLLRSIEGEGQRLSRGVGRNWRSLVPEFGEQVAEAFRDGARRHWRAYRPSLRSEGGDSQSIPYDLIFALAGLEIDAGDDGNGLAGLDRAEALHALRYTFHELNGFPHWLEPLFRASPEAGFDLIWGEVRWELAHSGAEPMHYALHDVVYYAPWLHAQLAQPIYDWLSQHGAANGDCLRFGRTIMISGGLPTTSLADLARRRVEDSKTPADQFTNWLAFWVDTAPEAALPVLEAHLVSLSEPADARFAERFVVALTGGRREAGLSSGLWKTPASLKRLYVLMHQHIRTSEDIDRANKGVYSPTERDDAQRARDSLFNLLSAIPGEATYREILALASDHPEPDYRIYMRSRAHERAVEDSDREWSLSAVLAIAPPARELA